MWRNFCLLSLILFTINFHPDRFARAEPIRTHSEIVTREDGYEYRKEAQIRGQRSEDTSSLVGKWRNNGEALEPKWRDGDTVPLLPFSHFSAYSRDDVDVDEQENRRGPRYDEQDGYSRLLSNERGPERYEYYERLEDRRNKYGDRDKHFQRAKGNLFGTAKRNDDNEARNRGPADSKDVTSSRYREAFQVRPNDYDHELNDEEYLKPRPRKRRPPQNYEFALAANEAMLRERQPENASRAGSRSNVRVDTATSASRNETKALPQARLSQNVELKSLLKMQQEEGLSLSEILQRRNLTLNDLLKGKADAINVLKSKDFEETDEYAEEASRIMSNSFAKISTTEKPQWTSNSNVGKVKNVEKENERLTLSDYDPGKLLFRNTPTLVQRASPTDSEITTSNILDRFKLYSETENVIVEKSTLRNLDPLPTKIATFATMSTVVTTPTPPNSMELFQSDDSNVRMQNSGEARSDGLDEDEIMEFSDFTDYKKGRNSASTVWLMVKDEGRTESPVKNMENEHQSTGSTLSIEQILSPTERTKPTENSSARSKAEQLGKYQPNVNDDRTSRTNDKITVIERPSDDYTIFFEHEYQADAPIINDDSTNNDTVTSDNRGNSGMSFIQEIQSALDSMENRGRNPVINYTSSSKELVEEEDENRNLRNHQDSDPKDRRYEDIVSEVEPEARAEIFELFASGSAAKRLERLLKSRNMSVEELIALRQRGSSKVHLAEVSRLRTQKPTVKPRSESKSNAEVTTSKLLEKDLSEVESKDTGTLGNRQTTPNKASYNADNSELSESLFENKPVNSRGSNSTDSVRVEDVTEESMTEKHNDSDNGNDPVPLDSERGSANCKQDAKEENSRHMVQIADLLTTFASLPFAKDIRQNFTAEVTDFADLARTKFSAGTSDSGVGHTSNDMGTARSNDKSSVIHSGYVEEIAKDETNFVTERTVYGEVSDSFAEDKRREEEAQTLSKVKPSIIASGAILGVTIVVFLGILITCRIKQKQRYRYRNRFSRAVFQGPVTTARKLSNSSSLSTVMVNVVATSTAKRPERNETHDVMGEFDPRSDIDNDSLDANDSWETIPDYMK